MVTSLMKLFNCIIQNLRCIFIKLKADTNSSLKYSIYVNVTRTGVLSDELLSRTSKLEDFASNCNLIEWFICGMIKNLDTLNAQPSWVALTCMTSGQLLWPQVTFEVRTVEERHASSSSFQRHVQKSFVWGKWWRQRG